MSADFSPNPQIFSLTVHLQVDPRHWRGFASSVEVKVQWAPMLPVISTQVLTPSMSNRGHSVPWEGRGPVQGALPASLHKIDPSGQPSNCDFPSFTEKNLKKRKSIRKCTFNYKQPFFPGKMYIEYSFQFSVKFVFCADLLLLPPSLSRLCPFRHLLNISSVCFI